MKTTVKQIATGTLIALILTVVNVKAEGTDKKDSTRENIETIVEQENRTNDETTMNSNFISFGELYPETETRMELEMWMTNSENRNLDFNYFEETETGLELESWMTNAETSNVSDLIKDEVLIIESWMIDSNIWK